MVGATADGSASLWAAARCASTAIPRGPEPLEMLPATSTATFTEDTLLDAAYALWMAAAASLGPVDPASSSLCSGPPSTHGVSGTGCTAPSARVATKHSTPPLSSAP